MILNLIYFILLIAVVVLFAWLTLRAARAKRWAIKIPGVLIAGALTLFLLLIVFLVGKGMALAYTPTSEPVPNIKVTGTPEQIARGKYLAYIGCAGCHGTNGEFPLTGGLDIANDVPMPIGSIVAPNITPGGVLKDRTDGELFRALRHGYGKDNMPLIMMGIMPYRQLSDDDTQAIIAFLRSQPAAQGTPNGGDNPNLLAALLFGAGMFPGPEPINKNAITAPTRAVNAEYGKYVATFGECRGCHGPDMTGGPPNPAQPDGVPSARAIRAKWTREQFIQTMRTGIRPNGIALAAGMPWINASRMDEQDLSALYEYITQAQ